jgi:excisionase family DNA binding protein
MLGKRGAMEKICIVKRRRMGSLGNRAVPRIETDNLSSAQVLTIALTREQMDGVRSNPRFQSIYGASEAPIFLALHLETPFPTKMLKSEQICDMLQISRSTLRRLVKTGVFRCHRIGRLIRFVAEDVMEYLSKGFGMTGLRSVRTTDLSVRPLIPRGPRPL